MTIASQLGLSITKSTLASPNGIAILPNFAELQAIPGNNLVKAKI
ncbi:MULTISPECIES: hypothetical protein [unclassified Moorena]|nr:MULTISPECIES: hypothetical protein [unclassified Moorena]